MRIVTRPDFDGVVCAVLLFEMENIDRPILWIEPGEVQKGEADIRDGDILANLPYDSRCSLWFDHHYTNKPSQPFEGSFGIAPSAARVVYEFYENRLQKDFSELVDAADKIDSADLCMDEVLNPEKYPYVLLSMSIGNSGSPEESFWNRLVELLRKLEIGEVLRDADVYRRCRKVAQRNRTYKDYLEQHTEMNAHVSITDFRQLQYAPEGNRFLVYSMFPEAVVSIKIRYADDDTDKIRISVGHSIFNQNCNVNVGLMLSRFGGGGHRAAGGCTFPAEKGDEYIPEMIALLVKNQPNE